MDLSGACNRRNVYKDWFELIKLWNVNIRDDQLRRMFVYLNEISNFHHIRIMKSDCWIARSLLINFSSMQDVMNSSSIFVFKVSSFDIIYTIIMFTSFQIKTVKIAFPLDYVKMMGKYFISFDRQRIIVWKRTSKWESALTGRDNDKKINEIIWNSCGKKKNKRKYRKRKEN